MIEINTNIIEKLSKMSEHELLASVTDGRIFTALSPDRINAYAWYPFRKSDEVLVIGGRVNSLCLLSERVARLDILTEFASEKELIRVRFPEIMAKGNCVLLPGAPDHKYDVVIDTEGTRERAFSFLKEGGSCLLSFENSDSMTLQTGAAADPEAAYISSADCQDLMDRAPFPWKRLYFPLPSLSFAKNIKGGGLLPAEGDFRGISESFTDERFAICNDEAVYDSLVRTDPMLIERFAPSYLLVFRGYEKETADTEPLPDYIRYNRERRKEYQIRTDLYQNLKCVKTALTPEGNAHICSFSEKYELLKGSLPEKITPCKPIVTEGPDGLSRAEFPFVKGESLGKILAGKIRDGKAPEEAAEMADLLADGSCYDLDILFDNCISDGDGYTLIDYEWVFPEAADPRFVRYRILRYFYEDNRESLYAYQSLSDFLIAFGFSESELNDFEVQEEDFQLAVHGSDKGAFVNKFRKPAKDVTELREAVQKASGRDRLLDEVSELKTVLSKEREVERLSQQHIRNLEKIVKAREAELEAERTELLYLRNHEALLSRARRKLIGRIDAWAPAGSRRRMMIWYIKGTILHPGTYLGRYFTKEGKILRRGDFEIGGEFPEGGILRLPETGEPLVSIVIPAYNQVQYTYACVRSILQNTDPAETPYEVILADDASTDITREIGLFIENIVISRTGGNLGFLRNCNEAAGKARGKYIFFLNNDTKVREGWLSSLCRLMAGDDSVGMCGSKLLYPDGRLQEAGGIIWNDASGWNYGRMDDPEKPEYNYVKEADYISGAAIMIRKELWEEIGGFDERYAPAYCEDSDLAFEVRRHGKRVVYDPASVVVHFEGVSNGTDVNGTGLKRYQVENQKKFREKWAEELKNQSVNTGNPNPFQARDRSQRKKTVLVIDHYVPKYDQDAGSKTTWQYLRMFLEKGYNVKFLPDNFLREEPYATKLMQAGIEVLYGDSIRDTIFDWIGKNQEYIDIAYLNRPHIAIKYIEYLRQNTGIRCIFYGHDLHFLRIRREFELTGDIRKRREADYWKSVEFQVMKNADRVYYPSWEEAEAVHEENPAIDVKAITAYIYDRDEENKREEPLPDQKEREGILFVGGFRHPPNADGVLWFIREIWPEIHKACPEMKFYIAGSHPTEEIEAQNGKDNVEVLGFVSEERLQELYRSVRIVVVPLRYGAGVKGKVIEALNEESAVVTTSVGAEGIPEAQSVMAVADRPKDFAGRVIRLYADSREAEAMREKCAPFIRKYYSTRAAWNIIAEDFYGKKD